jgi:hypothetical protein
MTKVKQFLSGKKSYLICVAAIAGALLAWVNGEIGNHETVTAIVAAIYGITLRAGVRKSGNE